MQGKWLVSPSTCRTECGHPTPLDLTGTGRVLLLVVLVAYLNVAVFHKFPDRFLVSLASQRSFGMFHDQSMSLSRIVGNSPNFWHGPD